MTTWQLVRGLSVVIGVAVTAVGAALAPEDFAIGIACILAGGVAVVGGMLFTPWEDDCGHPLGPADRLSIAGIWTQTRTRAAVRRLLQPGAWVTVVAVAAYGLLQLSKNLDKPGIWSGDSRWNWLLLGVACPAFLGTVLVSIGYPRLLRRVDKDAELRGVCQNAAVFAADYLDVSHLDLAVHVWRLRGVPGFRYLDRRAAFRPHGRPKTRITWRKGKGALGACWARDEPLVGDVEDLERQAQNREQFCELDPPVRFGLTWGEFRRVRHYRAVLVIPLHGGEPGRYSVRGIFAVGVLVDGKVDDLGRLAEEPELARRVLSVCEAALAGTPSADA
jgi:hypothetical protein